MLQQSNFSCVESSLTNMHSMQYWHFVTHTLAAHYLRCTMHRSVLVSMYPVARVIQKVTGFALNSGVLTRDRQDRTKICVCPAYTFFHVLCIYSQVLTQRLANFWLFAALLVCQQCTVLWAQPGGLLCDVKLLVGVQGAEKALAEAQLHNAKLQAHLEAAHQRQSDTEGRVHQLSQELTQLQQKYVQEVCTTASLLDNVSSVMSHDVSHAVM